MSPVAEITPMSIGGSARLAANSGTIDSINPATGEVIARIPRGDGDDVAEAVRAAREAYPGWRSTPAVERGARLRAMADAVDAHSEELALLDVRDNGSTLTEMRRDAAFSSEILRYFGGLALQVRGETIPLGDDRLNYTLRDPFGVVGRLIPFNHPMMFVASKIAGPLATGNTVVLKPSEHTSLSALRMAELFDPILAPGVLNVVTGYGHEAGDAMVVHPDVRRVAFVGAAATGRAIQARAASEVVKVVTLELGGKNPIIVLPDADLDLAVEGVVRGMNFTWQGQSCGSTSRLLVHQDIRTAFVERVVDRIGGLRVGMPEDLSSQVGAIVNRQQYEKVMGYIDIGARSGAKLLVGGGSPEDPDLAGGLFIHPTVFEEEDPSARLLQEEIFGPVLTVVPFRDAAHGLAIANGVRYGLTASVFTRDLELAHSFARDLEVGYVWINDSSKHFPGAPFGGFKDSGVGREEGLEELESYTQVKNVNVRYAPDREWRR